MILVPKLVVLILMCSTFYFEGAYSKKQRTCKKLKGNIGDVLTVTCKKAGRKAKWVESTCSGYYWEQIVISQGNLMTTLPYIGKEYNVAFDLEISSSIRSWISVITFTTGGWWMEDHIYGQRAPAVLIFGAGSFHIGSFHFSSSVNGNGNFYQDLPIDPQDNRYHIEISQSLYYNKYWYTIAVNHVSVFAIENTDAQQFDNVEMWAGNPWYPALNGTLRNVCVDI